LPLALLLALSLGAFASAPAAAQPQDPASPIMVPNPASDLWRAVRQREAPAAGATQVRGVETGVLIERSGDDWRNYRRQDFIGIGGIVLGVAAAVILIFYLVRGPIKIPGGRSGQLIERFPDFDRTLHWLTAVLFVFLALTGLTLLFGRFVVLPVFGAEAFSVIASACKEGHNLFGPLFLVAVVMLFLRFAAKNMPVRDDLTWLARGGGLFGKGHVSAGYLNAGEKLWFWAAIVLGTIVSVSGLVLLFPVFEQGREIMQLALVVHGIAAILFIAGSFGHIYIGTLGTEGAIDGMATGYVDANWAKAHHDLWYAEVTGEAVAPEHTEAAGSGAVAPLQTSADRA
jgi:formate dehydrogenase subunit gamma